MFDLGTSEVWEDEVLGEVTVYHAEEFRLKWAATKLVTFVFVINLEPGLREEIESYYDRLYSYAKYHKKSLLPRGLHLGYALLPIYVSKDFTPVLVESIKGEYVKKWSMFHIPSLFDTENCKLIKKEGKMIWGGFYASYISDALNAAENKLVSIHKK